MCQLIPLETLLQRSVRGQRLGLYDAMDGTQMPLTAEKAEGVTNERQVSLTDERTVRATNARQNSADYD